MLDTKNRWFAVIVNTLMTSTNFLVVVIGLRALDEDAKPLRELFGDASRTELVLAVLVLVILMSSIFYQYYAYHVRPFRSMKAVKEATLEFMMQGWARSFQADHEGMRVRLCIMKARQWGWGPLCRVTLKSDGSYNYKPTDRDAEMKFRIRRVGRKAQAEGICGLAWYRKEVVAGTPDDVLKNDEGVYTITPHQRRRTKNVLYVISAPVFDSKPHRDRVIGTFNLSLVADNAQRRFRHNEKLLTSLKDYVEDMSSHVSQLM